MKYKKCGKHGVLITTSHESTSSGLSIEIDTTGTVTVTRLGDGKQYVTKTDGKGKFFVPSAFLINGKYGLRVGEITCAPFGVSGGEAFMLIDSFTEEIIGMWTAIAELIALVESAEKQSEAARVAVEEFRSGYRTE